jgi:Fe-S cluster assembly protein SufD
MTLTLRDLATMKDESWKYTSLTALKDRKIDGARETITIPSSFLPHALCYVFDNGKMIPQGQQLEKGAFAGSINEPAIKAEILNLEDLDLLSRLTVDLCQDGFALSVPDNVELTTPIEIIFAARGATAAHLRLWLRLGKHASATIIERHCGDGAFTTTLRSDIALGAGARLQHYRLQEASAEAVVLAAGAVTLQENATYESFACSTGSLLSRHQVNVKLAGAGAVAHLNGAHILKDQSHCDTSTVIDHAVPHCTSRQTYKQVLDGASRGVFQGKIWVREHAQKTDGFQLNQALLLSPDAEVNGKPELEIYADDVKCSHGATVGQLDQNALFYLRSRGIPLAEARTMLVEAFIGSALDLIEHETIRAAFKANVAERLAGLRP